jgi:AcrR family transcriptional regulator
VGEVPAGRKVRADAQRNIETLLTAAKAVFMEKGVDAPMREIAAAAGVGVGTIYRHFPQRSDLIVAVFRGEIDACVTAATTFAAEYEPVEALTRFLQHYSTFVGTKRGLAAALHSGDPAYDALPVYFESQVIPELGSLLDAAVAAGEIRADMEPIDLIRAVANLSLPAHDDGPGHAQRMIGLIVDGLRYRASR